MNPSIIVQRGPEVDSDGTSATTGTGIGPDGFAFLTLEPLETLTPPGTYEIQVHPMASHGPALRVEIMGFDDNERFFHSINRASESRGCTGVGDTWAAPGLLTGGISHHVADKLAELVTDVIKADGKAWCLIKAAEVA